jgi:hypothetical protein
MLSFSLCQYKRIHFFTKVDAGFYALIFHPNETSRSDSKNQAAGGRWYDARIVSRTIRLSAIGCIIP